MEYIENPWLRNMEIEEMYEPDEVGSCDVCNNSIYNCESYYFDNMDNSIYCSEKCLKTDIGFKLIDPEEVSVLNCVECNVSLLPNKYEVYKTADNNYFCSEECCYRYYDIEYKTN